MWIYPVAIVLAALIPPAWGAEDPGARALQQHQLQRQQQQEALQLRMLQYQRGVQLAPAEAQQRQSLEQLQSEQRQRQERLHYRQVTEPATAQPSDDEGTRRAKSEIERQTAQQESQRQIRQSDRDLQQEVGGRDEPGAGVPVPRRKLKIPPDTTFGR